MSQDTEALTAHDVREAFAFDLRRMDHALAAESGGTPPAVTDGARNRSGRIGDDKL